jgi:hypothetical protein
MFYRRKDIVMDEATKAQIPADKSVAGVFSDRPAAERAYELLREMGYQEDDINVLLSDETRKRFVPSPRFETEIVGIGLNEGPGVGAAIGASAGLLFGALIGAAASIAFPGVGLIAVGPIASAIAGAGVGGMTGGLLGSLVGVGIPESDAAMYEEKLKQGSVIIGVTPRSDEDRQRILTSWRELGAELLTQD